MAFLEHHARSVAKTFTYRFLIIITNGFIIYLITGQLEQTLDIISVATVVSTVIYFAHERLWNHIHWGKHDIPNS